MLLRTKIASILIIALAANSHVFGGTASPEEAMAFEEQQITLQLAPELVPTKPKNNQDVLYHRAYKVKGEDFEIRIRYEVLAPLIAQYEESKKPGSNMVMVPPNNLFQSFFMVAMMNILQGDAEPRMNAFPPEAVKEEFNADAGLTSFGQGKSEFLGKYKYVLAYSIHKKDIGVATVFFLFNNAEKGAKTYKRYFYITRFK